MAPQADSRASTPDPAKLPPIPGSPSYSYASTANPLSSYNLPLPPPPTAPLGAVLTKKDLEDSQAAYAELLSSAKTYRLALASLSKSASAFGTALETCARLKEARCEIIGSTGAAGGGSLHTEFGGANTQIGSAGCTADNLLSASGVHQLIANHQQILSETVYRSFEVPLMHELDEWRRHMEEEEVAYLRSVQERSREIRRMEKEGLRLQKIRKRDVKGFREHLVQLTGLLDELTCVHGGYRRGLLREGQEASIKIVEAAGSLVRAEVEIFESLARKGWIGGGLERLLDRGVDLFANEDFVANESELDAKKLFSILPNKSILASASGSGDASSVPNLAHPVPRRGDSVVVEEGQYQSLAGAVNPSPTLDDSRSIFSASGAAGGGGTEHFNRSRGVRPFSPPPGLVRQQAEAEEGDGPLAGIDATEATPLLSEDDRGDTEESSKAPSVTVVKEVEHDTESTQIWGGDSATDGAADSTLKAELPVRAMEPATPKGGEEDEDKTLTPKLAPRAELKSMESNASLASVRSARSEGRRWSVTDDVVVSD